jgi:hypothetical protein
VDTVRLDDGNVLFRSDSLAVRLEGPAARLLAERVLPLLDGQRSLADLARQLPDVPIEELHRCLDGLVDAQVVRRAWHPIDRPSDAAPALGPFLALLDAIGVASGEALEALGRLRIAIFGLEGHGAHLATILVRCGIGGLMLVDPYPCEPGNLVLLPPLPASAIGTPRADALKTALHGCEGATEIATSGPDPLTRERIAGLARGCHALAGCFDRGFSSANHWINRASLEQGIPAIYGELRGHTALIGPLVLPGQTACYMCYRMRAVACESDFAAAMSYEEFLDQHRQPVLHQRAAVIRRELDGHRAAEASPVLESTVLGGDSARARCAITADRAPRGSGEARLSGLPRAPGP